MQACPTMSLSLSWTDYTKTYYSLHTRTFIKVPWDRLASFETDRTWWEWVWERDWEGMEYAPDQFWQTEWKTEALCTIESLNKLLYSWVNKTSRSWRCSCSGVGNGEAPGAGAHPCSSSLMPRPYARARKWGLQIWARRWDINIL